MQPEDLTREAVRRIVASFAPRRVLLFGSRAWGGAGTESDFDLFVVMPDDVAIGRLPGEIRRALRGLPASFDIIVSNERPFARWSRVPATLENRIAREGKALYDVAA